MSSIQFVQINARNLQETVEKIDGKKAIGFEVVDSTIIELLDCNIDPQHTGVKVPRYQFAPENKSASLVTLEMLSTIDNEIHNCVVFEKIDIDAVCAATLWLNADKLANMENEPVEHDKFLNLCQRVKSVDEMDCGLGNAGNDWNPDFYKTQLGKGVTDFNVLGAMCADFKCDINFKIGAMFAWLTTGELPEKYQKQQLVELEKEQSAIISQLHDVTCVETTARNVSSLIYSQSPFGVAFNSEFPTPNGKIPKFTIMAFNGRDYLDFASILADLNELESGWGGNLNAGIIGSPFAGTSLTPDTVCEIVSRHVK